MSLLAKAVEAIAEKGPKEGLRFVWDRAKTYVVDGNREIVLLAVDLTNLKHHVRPRDQTPGFELLPLERSIIPKVAEMLSTTEPARIPNLADRLDQGCAGLVGLLDGDVIGYVFFIGGTDDPTARVHPDLDWVPFSPRADEVYTFDYFVPEHLRGAGNLLARAVQQRQHEMGFRRAYGYVYTANRAGLWLYRTIGWKEVGRITEHKILLKLAVVEDQLFFIRQYDRALLTRVPSALLGRLR